MQCSSSIYGKIDLTNYENISNHLSVKQDNRTTWLGRYSEVSAEESSSDWFPYSPKTGCKAIGKVSSVYETYSQEIFPSPLSEGDTSPCYLSLIPHLPQGSCKDLSALLGRIRDEGFASTSEQSVEETSSRHALVVGINQMKSMKPSLNHAFREYVDCLREVDGIAYRIISTLWSAVWTRRPGYTDKTYRRTAAYRLLAALHPEAAERTRQALEGEARGQCPMQEIREWIKNSKPSQEFVDHFREECVDSPLYISSLDDDTVALRSKKADKPLGLFSVYDAIISEMLLEKGYRPQLMSPGYFVSTAETDSLQLIVNIDMAIRAAMASTCELSPYYPEPAMAFELEASRSLTDWSFMGSGRVLESQRLVENAVKSGLLEAKRAVFINRKALLTDPRASWRLKKHNEIGLVREKNIGTLKLQKGLSGTSQTHAFPRQWGQRMYSALPMTASLWTASAPLGTLLSIFVPQNFTEGLIRAQQDRYAPKKFMEALGNHERYVALLRQALLGTLSCEDAKAQLVTTAANAKEVDALNTVFQAGYERGCAAMMKLAELKLGAEGRGLALEAAARSGTAVTCEIRKWIQETS